MTKRIFDLFFSIVGILALLPVYIIVALAIKIDSRGPILFKQVRVGKDQTPFKILKFRTMCLDAEKKGGQITVGGRDPRVTQVGYYLRKFKLDELPQLFNVFLGEMSLVGPRPEVPRYVELYTTEQLQVLSVRPGITDLASIEFSNENEILAQYEDPEKAYREEIMQKKLALNLQYIHTKSLSGDIMLILKTVGKIF